jgi:hypothetical protein
VHPNKPYSIILGSKWGTGEAVALPLSHLTHMHCMGRTGYGKTSLLESICVQCILQGVGVSLLDPGGDFSHRVLRQLVAAGFYEKHPDAFERFVHLDVARAAKQDRYFAMNVLAGDYDPYTAADIVLESFKRVWVALQDGTSTNIEMLVKLAAFVLAYHKLPLIPYLNDILGNPSFRQQLLNTTKDWYIRKGFAELGIIPKDGKIADIAHTTLKRSYLLSFAPVVRYALAQQENILDFSDLLKNNRSIAINLKLADPEAKRLLGCLFTVQAEMVAKSWEGEPNWYLLMIDEMQNFVGQSEQALSDMFAETRKAGVFVAVAHQYYAQLPEGLQAALSQCDIIASFRVGREDALFNVGHLSLPIFDNWPKPVPSDPSAPWRAQYYTENEQIGLYARMLQRLPHRQAFVHLHGDRVERIQALDISGECDKKRLSEVEDEYLRRYFRPRADIEHEIETIRADISSFQVKPIGSSLPESAPPERLSFQLRNPPDNEHPLPEVVQPQKPHPKPTRPKQREETHADTSHLYIPEDEDDAW